MYMHMSSDIFLHGIPIDIPWTRYGTMAPWILQDFAKRLTAAKGASGWAMFQAANAGELEDLIGLNIVNTC